MFAYRDTQVCEKKSLLGRIMLGYFSSSDMIWKHRMCKGKPHALCYKYKAIRRIWWHEMIYQEMGLADEPIVQRSFGTSSVNIN